MTDNHIKALPEIELVSGLADQLEVHIKSLAEGVPGRASLDAVLKDLATAKSVLRAYDESAAECVSVMPAAGSFDR